MQLVARRRGLLQLLLTLLVAGASSIPYYQRSLARIVSMKDISSSA
jgi:hypothetical protein